MRWNVNVLVLEKGGEPIDKIVAVHLPKIEISAVGQILAKRGCATAMAVEGLVTAWDAKTERIQ